MCGIYRELFPSSRCLFIYRDFDKVAKSVSRTTQVAPSPFLAFQLGKLSGRVTKMMVDAMGADGSNYCVRVENDLVPGVVLSAATTAMYLDFYRRGFDIRAVRYEDLVAHPLDMCRIILEFYHLPVSLAELAVKAFEVDSQRNSFLSRSILGRIEEAEMTPQIKRELNGLLKKYGMPLIGEPGILEGTLTSS